MNNLTEFTYSSQPVGFLLILMTGYAYNFMTYEAVCDGKKRPLDFPDNNAYYSVLVPIWEKTKVTPSVKDYEEEKKH